MKHILVKCHFFSCKFKSTCCWLHMQSTNYICHDYRTLNRVTINFIYTLLSSSASNLPMCNFLKHIALALIGVNIKLKYLKAFVVFFIGFHQQLSISMRSWQFFVYKHSYCFVGISLRGVKISFLKKKCVFVLSIFTKLCVKTYCIIGDY